MLYLDCAASAPVFPGLLSEEERLLYANPSAKHRMGLEAAELLESCRSKIVELFSLRQEEQVVFCSSATEANNLAIYNQLLPKLFRRKSQACYSKLDHASCIQPLKQLRAFGLELHEVPLSSDGRLLLGRSFAKQLEFATVTAVESESGRKQDLAELVGEIAEAQARRLAAGSAPVYVHADLSQYLACERSLSNLGKYLELAFDSIALSGQKIGAGRGAGILLQRRPPSWSFSQGGGQEGGLRSGTENIAAILAMQRAIERQASGLQSQRKFLRQLAERPGILLQPGYRSTENPADGFSPYIFSLAIPPLPAEVLQRLLSERAYMVGTGSACSGKGSSAKLLALGYAAKLLPSVLRISFGTGASCAEDFAAFLDCLVEFQDLYA